MLDSPSSVLALISIVTTLAVPTVGWIVWRNSVTEWRQSVQKKLDQLEHAASDSALAQFIARDAERERHWLMWRDGVDKQIAARALLDDVEGLHEWKHRVVDPYIPGAVDAIKERVDRLDRRVFNGGSRE